ncbi:MAG TPA: copper resistance protein CopC [Nocardioides sp.]|uniref:copper resistance CopC/CopD family protein n=1 Tax=Nocardioides sp. TaxID=35761 RepID=UPI002D809834|nr:copper resistance protein CopC [Nocardioides sp.]HET6653410.1 copper resistance protein CopC [Nocardioides sp.]
MSRSETPFRAGAGTSPPGRSRRNRRGLLAGLLLAWIGLLGAAQLAAAGAAAAHAELVSTTPADGAQLAAAPAEVELRFTEAVRLVDGGLRLLDDSGAEVGTEDPTADGDTVRWTMPAELPDGRYLANWRVVSADGHPVAGAFAFGVGVAAEAVGADSSPERVAPWPVLVAKFGGYLGFVVAAGAVTVAVLCWPEARDDRRLHALLRGGLLVAAASTLASLLLQGPYTVGQPLTDLVDRTLLAEAAGSPFGAWTQARLYVLLAATAVLWPVDALTSRMHQVLAVAALVLVAVTFTGTGHAAPDGLMARAVDSAHVVAAGVWVGGLAVLAVTSVADGPRPPATAFAAFSRLALGAVLVLVGTGAVNGVLRLASWSQLWSTDYGRVLLAKLALVTVALVAAGGSRRHVQEHRSAIGTVRIEALVTVAVVVVTAALSTIPPPANTGGAVTQPSVEVVTLDLAEGRAAELHVDPAGTGGSALHLELRNGTGAPLRARTVELRAVLPEQDLGPLEVPLFGRGSVWEGDFAFPFAGEWQLTLTVANPSLGGLVTTGNLAIR